MKMFWNELWILYFFQAPFISFYVKAIIASRTKPPKHLLVSDMCFVQDLQPLWKI